MFERFRALGPRKTRHMLSAIGASRCVAPLPACVFILFIVITVRERICEMDVVKVWVRFEASFPSPVPINHFYFLSATVFVLARNLPRCFLPVFSRKIMLIRSGLRLRCFSSGCFHLFCDAWCPHPSPSAGLCRHTSFLTKTWTWHSLNPLVTSHRLCDALIHVLMSKPSSSCSRLVALLALARLPAPPTNTIQCRMLRTLGPISR